MSKPPRPFKTKKCPSCHGLGYERAEHGGTFQCPMCKGACRVKVKPPRPRPVTPVAEGEEQSR